MKSSTAMVTSGVVSFVVCLRSGGVYGTAAATEIGNNLLNGIHRHHHVRPKGEMILGLNWSHDQQNDFSAFIGYNCCSLNRYYICPLLRAEKWMMWIFYSTSRGHNSAYLVSATHCVGACVRVKVDGHGDGAEDEPEAVCRIGDSVIWSLMTGSTSSGN